MKRKRNILENSMQQRDAKKQRIQIPCNNLFLPEPAMELIFYFCNIVEQYKLACTSKALYEFENLLHDPITNWHLARKIVHFFDTLLLPMEKLSDWRYTVCKLMLCMNAAKALPKTNPNQQLLYDYAIENVHATLYRYAIPETLEHYFDFLIAKNEQPKTTCACMRTPFTHVANMFGIIARVSHILFYYDGDVTYYTAPLLSVCKYLQVSVADYFLQLNLPNTRLISQTFNPESLTFESDILLSHILKFLNQDQNIIFALEHLRNYYSNRILSSK